jgi:hypothetical protein
MSHVDAIAVLLEYLKLTALSAQQGERISRRGAIQPIAIEGVPALKILSVNFSL